MNKQLEQALQKLLGVSGPVAAFLSNKYGLDATTTGLIVEVLAAILTPLAAIGWGWITNRETALVSAVAQMPAPAVQEALAKVPDDVKVKVAEAVPGVATVVVKDDANGSLGALAASPEHPNIVTASRNEQDAKHGHTPKE